MSLVSMRYFQISLIVISSSVASPNFARIGRELVLDYSSFYGLLLPAGRAASV